MVKDRPMTRCTITLPVEDAVALALIARGNISAGVRMALASAIDASAEIAAHYENAVQITRDSEQEYVARRGVLPLSDALLKVALTHVPRPDPFE